MKVNILLILTILFLINLNLNVQSKPLINIQVDGECLEKKEGLARIIDELVKRELKATIYVTTLFVNEHRPLIEKILSKTGFEIAIHGYKTGEILESLTYEDQKFRIKSTYTALTGCLFCNSVNIPYILGFRPQYFSQNEDTFSILDELGIQYNSGFIEKIKYSSGHEDDSSPYKIEGHKFYAVPISSYYYEPVKERIYLCDMSMKYKYKFTADQWLEILVDKLKESVKTEEPMVIIIHDIITGSDDAYFNTFIKFLDEIKARNLKTLTTIELVEIYREVKK